MAGRRDHFNRYYLDELEFLREMGGEFARAYPDIAAELGLPSGKDPDVQQLLQGFAFLTARIRQGLDAEFPHLLYPLLQLLHPHALRPTPSACIVEFAPVRNVMSQPLVLPRGTRWKTPALDGTVCWFRTCAEVVALPLEVGRVAIEAPSASRSELVVELLALPGAALGRLGDRLQLHLSGSVRQAYGLHLWLARSLRSVRVRALGKDGGVTAEVRLPGAALRALGFSEAESLLPYPAGSFGGYRHLLDYFVFPEKYLFWELSGLSRLGANIAGERLELRLELLPLLDEALSVTRECVRINCAPSVNLARHAAEPLELRETRAEHHIRPAVTQGDSPAHYDIFSIESVEGPRRPSGSAQDRRAGEAVAYDPFFSFQRPAAGARDVPVLYQVHLRPPVTLRGGGDEGRGSGYPPVETYLSFVDGHGRALTGAGGVVSVDLLVTNHDLPARRLRQGAMVRSEDVPASVGVNLLTAPSIPAPAPLGQDGLWRFFGHQLWGHGHLRDVGALRSLLTLHHAPAMYDLRARDKLEQLLQSLQGVRARAVDLMQRLDGVGPPAVLRGTQVELDVDELRVGHPGELHLFGAVLSHFLAETASVNTFSRLVVRGLGRGLRLEYPARSGVQEVL